MSNIFTNYQINEFRNSFLLVEKKKDYIESKQLCHLLRKLNYYLTKQELNYYSNKYNDNGFIHFTNFLKILENLYNIQIEEELLVAFRIFDREMTGYINKDKLVEILTTIGDVLNKDEINDLINITTIDKNGNIDYKELVKNILVY